jgi:hypothetical protein
LINTSYYQPLVFPYNGDSAPVEIDRAQDLSGSLTLNREKIKEIGRDGTVGWSKRTPTESITLKQYEYGNIEFFRKVANLGDSVTAVTLNDFKTSMVDIAGFSTDDNGTFLGTVWYPKLRLSNFSIDIGSPTAIITRSFQFAGEDEYNFTNNNKYLIYVRNVAASPGIQTITLNNPSPVTSPDESGNDGYILRVLQVRAGVTTELTYGTDYSFTPASTLTINAGLTADVYKIYYTGTTYISGQSIFTPNDSDASALDADSCDIWLQTTNYLYKLQSANVNVTLDRTDYSEIGNSQIVQRGIKNKTVTVTLGRYLEAYTIEQVLRGVSTTYGVINPRNFSTNNSLKVKFYSNAKKDTFKYELRLTNLSPTSLTATNTVDDYSQRQAVMESEELVISSVAS